MSTRRSQERIADILDALEEILRFVEGMTFQEFQSDNKTLKAVMADFTIMGEAAGQVPETLTSQYSTIPWAVMRGMRNRLVHVYFSVSPKILWDTIQHDLPTIVEPLQQLLADLNDDLTSSTTNP